MSWCVPISLASSLKHFQQRIKPLSVARILVKEWFIRFGVPKRIHSDEGKNFESALIKELCAIYGITKS